MTPNYALGLLGALTTLVVVFEMLRRRQLREKHAVLWIVIAAGTVVMAFVPGLLEEAATLTGVAIPANLLFFVASMVLLIVSVQLSYEVGRLEARTQTLAEDLGLLRLELEQREAQPPPAPPSP